LGQHFAYSELRAELLLFFLTAIGILIEFSRKGRVVPAQLAFAVGSKKAWSLGAWQGQG